MMSESSKRHSKFFSLIFILKCLSKASVIRMLFFIKIIIIKIISVIIIIIIIIIIVIIIIAVGKMNT